MSYSNALHERLNMIVSSEAYVFDPIDEVAETAQRLVISRRTGEVALSRPGVGPPPVNDVSQTVYGIMGTISLLTSDFLIVITNREAHGQIDGHPIYRATNFQVLPLPPPPSSRNDTERHLLKLVENHLQEGVFWLSYGWDLTTRLQAQAAKPKDGKALWELADDRFFWNKHLQSKLIDVTTSSRGQNLSRFILPVMYGSFDLRFTTIARVPFVFCLISRRSRYRAGTRYFTRGVDAQGHVANFNETEQLILLDASPTLDISPNFVIPPSPFEPVRRGSGNGAAVLTGNTRMSFVQTRGSAPIGFAEINNLRYVPDLSIMDSGAMLRAFGLHVDEQLSIYGNQVVFVNLVNSTGRERLVKEDFEQRVKEREVASAPGVGRGRERVVLGGSSDNGGSRSTSARRMSAAAPPWSPGHVQNSMSLGVPLPKRSSPVQYYYFDFHKECSKMRFKRVSLLLDRLESTIEDGKFFHQSLKKPSPLLTQTNIIRSNCMDCLDRTNVVQAAVAKKSLTLQLRAAGVLSEKEAVEDHKEFMAIFREVWADHADYISEAYSGTPALKTDFTRTGKRTKAGLWKDFLSSCKRYAINNFLDGERQDAFDLFTGAWVATGGHAGSVALSFTDKRPLLVQSMPYVLLFSFFMLVASIFLSRTATYSLTYYLAMWSTLCALSLTFIFAHGIEYVAWPHLNPPLDIVHYDGPGVKTPEHGRGQLWNKLPSVPLPYWITKQLRTMRANGSTGPSSRRIPLKGFSKMEEVEMGKKRRAD